MAEWRTFCSPTGDRAWNCPPFGLFVALTGRRCLRLSLVGSQPCGDSRWPSPIESAGGRHTPVPMRCPVTIAASARA